MRDFRRNRQPHFQARNTSYSVTILLHDALTGPQVERVRRKLADALDAIRADGDGDKALRIEKARTESFLYLENLLHAQASQSHALSDAEVAGAVVDYLRKFDEELYRLHACSVMSNHAHALFDLSPQFDESREDIAWPVDRLIGRLKGGSAHAANQLLGRSGTLWMRGYHDRYVRSVKHFVWVKNYILQNPVKAGLVGDWRMHAGTWCPER